MAVPRTTAGSVIAAERQEERLQLPVSQVEDQLSRFFFQDFSCEESKAEFNVDAPNGVVMEGYLFKRASNAFKSWNR